MFSDATDNISFRNELCGMLADVPLFDNLSDRELRLLIPYLQPHHAHAGATIVEKGHLDNHLGIVLEGKVIAYIEDDTGSRRQLAVVTPGMSFGETSLADDLPYPGMVIADTEVKLVLLSREDFRRIAGNHAVIAVRLIHKICRLFSQQLRQSHGPLVEYLG